MAEQPPEKTPDSSQNSRHFYSKTVEQLVALLGQRYNVSQGRKSFVLIIIILFLAIIDIFTDIEDVFSLFGSSSTNDVQDRLGRIEMLVANRQSSESVEDEKFVEFFGVLTETLKESQNSLSDLATRQAEMAHEAHLATLSRQRIALPEPEEAAANSEASASNSAPNFEPFIWTQLHPDQMLKGTVWEKNQPGALIARAVVPSGESCPPVTINGLDYPMKPRAPTYPTTFPIVICESPQPYPGDARAIIGLSTLQRRTENTKRILLIGDTGCRVTFFAYQECEVSEGGKKRWPFWKIARLASQEKVDLIIHVGDYHYRERPCPANTERTCGTVDGGYIWEAWLADFFEPARTLLASAPWVFVRGNHENCARAGAGWNDLFWPSLRSEAMASCQDHHEPYMVKLADDLSLVVLDVANAEDEKYYSTEEPESRAAIYQRWMKALNQTSLQSSVWIAMHQPPWQWPLSSDDHKEQAFIQASIRDKETISAIKTQLVSFARDASSISVDLVLSGDTHIFEALKPEKGTNLPWVVVSGMGGTSLNGSNDFVEGLSPEGHSLTLDDQELTAFGWYGFGYTILDEDQGSWRARVFNEEGRESYRCVLTQDGGCQKL